MEMGKGQRYARSGCAAPTGGMADVRRISIAQPGEMDLQAWPSACQFFAASLGGVRPRFVRAALAEAMAKNRPRPQPTPGFHLARASDVLNGDATRL